jgi:O-methyltransferase involved in polyketide biosynthesis
MEKPNQLNLGSVQETLLLPLWGRAMETQKEHPLLIDRQAVAIIKSIPYDFTVIAQNIHKLVQAAWIARGIFFDNTLKAFIEKYPEATIVNIGCGLDTTFDRVDNGKLQWYDLDLPDVIILRKNYIAETERRRFLSYSVFDVAWYNEIKKKSHVLFLIAGVLYYFDEQQVKELFGSFGKTFPGVEVIFDYSSKKGVAISNKKVIEQGGMNKSAYLRWGIDDIAELERWNEQIHIIKTMPMYHEHKKNYWAMRRLGMNISDWMKIMSLAHVRIG